MGTPTDDSSDFTAGPVDRTVDLGAVPVARAEVRPWLFVVHGNDRTRFIPVQEAGVRIGRSSEAEVVLHDEGVSKVHCSVRLGADGAVEVVDHGSRNGTFVDGVRIEKAVLRPNSEIHLGKTVMRLELKDPAQVRFEEEMFRAATTDGLTGVLNRRSFLERAAAELAKPSRSGAPAAVFVDVDHFKKVNDTHGHAAGDAVLKEVARRIGEARRAEDLLCRYGGEEFVLLLPGVDAAEAADFAERIRSALASRPVACDGKEIPVTASLGVGLRKSGEDLEALLQRADAAMYRAKESGRDRVVLADPDVSAASR